jgi:hypothetical protein
MPIDYQIPMGAPAAHIQQSGLTPVDPNIAASVKPFAPIDPMGNTKKAYSLAEGVGEFNQAEQQRQDEAKDRAALQALQEEGVNFHTPEGLSEALEKGKNLSPKAQQGLLKTLEATQAHAIEYQKHLGQLDKDTLASMKTATDDAHERSDYIWKRWKKENADDPLKAMENFTTGMKALATMERANVNPETKQPKMKEEDIAQLEKATPEILRDKIDAGAYGRAQIKEALDAKLKSARALSYEGKSAQSIEQLDTLEAAREAGEVTPEQYDERKKMILAAGSGSRGTLAGLAGRDEATISDAERRLSVGQWIINPSSLRGQDKTVQQNVTKWAAELGITPEDVLAGRAQLKFDLSSATSAGRRAGTLAGVEATMPKLISNALEASAAVDRKDFVPYNQIVQWGAEKLSNPKLRALKAANLELASEFQQVISRGGPNVTALKMAMEMFQTAESPEAYKTALDMANKAVEANVAGSKKVRADLSPKHTATSDPSANAGRLEIMNQELAKAQEKLAAAKTPEDKTRAQGDIDSVTREIAGLGGAKPVAKTTKKLAPDDQQALDWATANPQDPRAVKIRQKLGV